MLNCHLRSFNCSVFALLVGLHAIPLAPPDLGVKSNIGALVRSAIGHAVLTVMWVFYMAHSQGLAKEFRPLKTIIRSIVLGGFVSEGLWAALSLLWRYPVPGIGLIKFASTLGCIIFLSRCSQTMEYRVRNRQRARIITIVMTGYLLIVLFYLLLALAFARSPWGIQLGLIVLQPALRSLIKRKSWVYARKLSDLSTDVTLNIVDMSALMYQALCVQYTSYPGLAALIVFEDCFLGIAVAHMYATHIFIVDGYRTLQTSIKIVEGSLSSTLVVEEEETQQEEAAHSDHRLPSQQIKVDRVTNTQVGAIQTPKSTQRLRRASSDKLTVTNNPQLSTAATSTPDKDHQRFLTVMQKVCLVVSDPVAEKDKLQLKEPPRRHSIESNVGGHSQLAPKYVQRLRRASSGTAKDTNYIKPHGLHRRMTAAVGGPVRSPRAHRPPASLKTVQLLRRTASDTISESKFERERPIDCRDTTRDGDVKDSSTSKPHLQSWARDPSKVYCLADVRPEASSPPPTPKQTRSSQGRCSSTDLPSLGDLQSADGFGRRPPLRRSTSIFLTPRTLMKSGSKRLLDLGRNTSGNPGDNYASSDSPTEARKPSQVSIDGMLVVRKDQARILEQTLHLLFSCEVLVVAEFVKVIVPLLQGT